MSRAGGSEETIETSSRNPGQPDSTDRGQMPIPYDVAARRFATT